MNGSGMLRRSLGRRLRTLRERSGKSMDDVRNIGSRNKIWRMETGRGPYRYADVQGLCLLYGADARTTEQLTQLALRTTEESRYDEYADVVPPWLVRYLELEVAATAISTFQPEVVPGLLQTEEYARAVFAARRPPVGEGDLERLVRARRQRRRSVLGAPSRAGIDAVVGEGVLLRQVGGPEVAAAETAQLRRDDREGRARIRVLTWDGGAHPAMDGAFSLLEFADPDEPSVAYQEDRTGARYLERPAQVQGYRAAWAAIVAQSVPLREYAP